MRQKVIKNIRNIRTAVIASLIEVLTVRENLSLESRFNRIFKPVFNRDGFGSRTAVFIKTSRFNK